MPNSQVKLEPMEHLQEQHQAQYFTNPIPFKQEPNELNHENQKPTSSSSSSSGGGEPAAIVNNLLKDQQVLNLLEKVAEAFRPPTQSMYQGSWNFH